MRYYIIRIQVDFEPPREMPPLRSSGRQWRSIGYYQTFYCTEKSTKKAKQLVRDFYQKNEINPDACKFRFEHSMWMKGITRLKQLSMASHELTEEMFEKIIAEKFKRILGRILFSGVVAATRSRFYPMAHPRRFTSIPQRSSRS